MKDFIARSRRHILYLPFMAAVLAVVGSFAAYHKTIETLKPKAEQEQPEREIWPKLKVEREDMLKTQRSRRAIV